MKAYQHQDSTQTVREALEEYRQDIPSYFDERVLTSESARFFHNHDICHVVFGCHTSEIHEALVDTWTMLASDVGVRNYLRFLNLPEIKELMKIRVVH